MTFLLIVGALLGLGVAVIAFILNSSTPMQTGPIPTLGGFAVFVVCVVVAIARHIVWR